MTITKNNWLAQLRRVGVNAEPDGFTTYELSKAIGCSQQMAADRLRDAARQGLVEFAGRRPSTRIDGGRCSTPVYRFVAQKPRRRPSKGA